MIAPLICIVLFLLAILDFCSSFNHNGYSTYIHFMISLIYLNGYMYHNYALSCKVWLFCNMNRSVFTEWS